MFRQLISVSRVGPKVALAALSAMSPADLAAAIVTGNENSLARAPGLGKKTAQRVILELREKISAQDAFSALPAGAAASPLGEDIRAEAMTALVALGYDPGTASRAVAAVHAGWRGTASGIVTRAVEKMRDCYGTDPADLLAAIGPGTARALAAHGLRPDYVPEVYDASHLGEGLPATGKVLALRAEEGSPALTEGLARRNIACDDVASYRTVYDNPRSQQLRAAVEGTEGLLVTFTSASTVKGFVSSVGEDANFSRMVGMCIGAQTAAEAQKYGIPVRVAREATMDALVELITEGV